VYLEDGNVLETLETQTKEQVEARCVLIADFDHERPHLPAGSNQLHGGGGVLCGLVQSDTATTREVDEGGTHTCVSSRVMKHMNVCRASSA
jgi:hypothetical protein